MFRYMDPHNDTELASKAAMDYWENVDLYIGGSEHATGHLLYSRFWVKFLYDRGFLSVDEPFKKLINQGMIQGESAFIYKLLPGHVSEGEKDKSKISQEQIEITEFIEKIRDKIFVSDTYARSFQIDFPIENKDKLSKSIDEFVLTYPNFLKKKYPDDISVIDRLNYGIQKIHVDISFVKNSNELDTEAFKNSRPEFNDSKFITEDDGIFKVSREIEKMSKSKYNVVNPDDICEQYGADTLRMYEMFLGPLEQAKPWNTAGISGVHSFLKKMWKLYHSGAKDGFEVGSEAASKDSLKTLHKTIKKVEEDIENFSFNTSVSSFMIAVNELTAQKSNSREILEPLAILISPYAPHIAEELWEKLGHKESISTAPFPKFESEYLIENSKEYPISFNGKTRFTMELPLDMSKDDLEAAVMAHEKTIQYLDGRTPKKVVVVPGKIINIVG
jgi:leucyl-tRNA synthetase